MITYSRNQLLKRSYSGVDPKMYSFGLVAYVLGSGQPPTAVKFSKRLYVRNERGFHPHQIPNEYENF